MAKCLTCGCDLVDELDVTLATMRQLDCGGDCLSCMCDAENRTYWQHADSDSVWTGSKTGDWSARDMAALDPSVDEIFKDTFFQRIAEGWSYEL